MPLVRTAVRMLRECFSEWIGDAASVVLDVTGITDESVESEKVKK